MRRQALIAGAAAICALAGCDAGETKIIGSHSTTAACTAAPAAPPAGVDPFYAKYYDVNGIPVMSSSAVSDTALASACTIVGHMVSLRADVRQMMIQQEMRVAVIGQSEVTTNVPEYRNLNQMFPQQDWDLLRGVGATRMIPVSSVGEENLSCLAGDWFAGEHLLVQTFATAVLLGLDDADATFDSRLGAAYDNARAAGLWQDTYARVNSIEYFAEGVQSWFDANPDVSPPDGTHNDINTRAELRSYDPALAALIAEAMPDDAWRPKCP
jgi:hypothetical protein